MSPHEFLMNKRAITTAVLGVACSLALAGCNGVYKPIPPPPDTVTFPAASTQGWLQQIGTGYVPAGANEETANGDTAYGIATDPLGNVIVLDETLGAFPGFTSSNNQAEFAVIKFDGAGNQVWAQQFGTGSGDFPNAIATDSQGNIFVGGFTYGSFPGFTNSSGSRQSVVMKLSSAGQMVWTQQFASVGGRSQVTALAVDPQGNVVLGGSYGSRYNPQGYVMKLAAADGTTLWSQGNGSGSTNYGVSGVAVDSQGNVIAVGGFPGTGRTVYMVAELDGGTGQQQWVQVPVTYSVYGTQNLLYTQVALDASGNIFVGGLDNSTGYNGCAVAQLANGTGTQQWEQSFGAAQACVPGNLATDTAGNVLMAGNMFYPFFPASNPPNTDDVFLAKLSGSGAGVWLQQFGTGQDIAEQASSAYALMFVATDAQNHAFVAGTTTGAFTGFTNPNNANELFVTQFGQ